MKVFLKHILIPVELFLLPGFAYPQNIQWETTYDNGENTEVISDLVTTSNQEIIAVGYGYPLSDGEPSMLKFDSLGNFKWFKRLRFDTFQNGDFKFIERIPEEDNYYYAGGSAYELSVWNNDFIAKIDSAGDSVWVRRYHYATFYGTTKSAIVLKDKSIVTIGDLQTVSDFDILARRVDSLGNTLWEKIYNFPGVQNGYDVVEMMDGSLILAGSNNGDNFIMRVGFDGRMIDTFSYSNSVNVALSYLTLLSDNSLVQTGVGNPLSGTFKNFNIFNDSSYTSLDHIPTNAFYGIFDSDSNFVFGNFHNDSLFIKNFNPFTINEIWTYEIGSVNEPYNSPQNIKQLEDNNFFVVGSRDSSNIQNYWIAKIGGIGPKWTPNHCDFSPPVAGFEYIYDYPLLTLYDTSYSGLKYLDTIYTWQWNTSAGGGNLDSLSLFFDTAISKTLDVELIIGNWYECQDTVQRTLNFDPNGINVVQDFEVNVFPNPTTAILHVQTDDRVFQNKRIRIMDLNGKTLFSKDYSKPNTTLNIENLKPGIYFYSIESGGMIKRGKVLKL